MPVRKRGSSRVKNILDVLGNVRVYFVTFIESDKPPPNTLEIAVLSLVGVVLLQSEQSN